MIRTDLTDTFAALIRAHRDRCSPPEQLDAADWWSGLAVAAAYVAMILVM